MGEPVRWLGLGSAVCNGRYVYRARHEFVAGAVDGQKEARVGRVRLELLAEAQDVVVDRAGGRIVLVAPDFVEQFVARENATRRGGEEFEELKFLRGEGDRLAGMGRFHAGEVYACLTK